MTTKDTLLLYEQPQLPTFQNRVYPTAAEAKACAKGDIRLVQDMKTGLVYNDAFDPKLMDYDGNYNNEQGVSRHFHQHLEMVAGIVERTMGRENLVEVGCGKGLFLEMLLEKGFDLTGFDPTYEGTNPRVKRHYFEAGVDVQGEGLILRHVLEHIQSPYDFLVELCKANGGKGRIYIEVPCFDWIMEHRAWFDVFYEHVNYFRLSDFHRIFGNVIESGRVFGGQYLYVVAELDSLRRRCAKKPIASRFPPTSPARSAIELPRATVRRSGVARRRGDLLAVEIPSGATGRHGHRHQSRQTGQIPAGDRPDGAIAGPGPGEASPRLDHLRHELQLSRGNSNAVSQRLYLCGDRQ